MFKTLANAWKIPDIRKKILFTAFIVLLFRIGANIPTPFVSIIGEDGLLGATEGTTFLNYLSMMTGDAFNYGTIFALSITPYINSSIIIQLLTVAIPALERLSKEGEEGRKKIAKITRYVTLALGLLQSVAYFIYLRAQNFLLYKGEDVFPQIFQGVVIVSVLTAGTTLVMWLGEQINNKGIGNGISIILFAGIISRIPTEMTGLFGTTEDYIGAAFTGSIPRLIISIVVVISYLLMIAYIVWMDNAERRIPVQYAKRVVGRKMYGGQSTHIPIKVNMSGVMPVIFASSILSLPPTIELFVSASQNYKEDGALAKFFDLFDVSNPFYCVIYFILIIFFAYFYAAIQYNPVEMANNIRNNSGTIPGIRPGKPTAMYIQKIISRIILLGALLLSVVALFPNVFALVTELILGEGQGMHVSLGGTSIIIMVGVALETVKQLESQMMLRHYKGFLD